MEFFGLIEVTAKDEWDFMNMFNHIILLEWYKQNGKERILNGKKENYFMGIVTINNIHTEKDYREVLGNYIPKNKFRVIKIYEGKK